MRNPTCLRFPLLAFLLACATPPPADRSAPPQRTQEAALPAPAPAAPAAPAAAAEKRAPAPVQPDATSSAANSDVVPCRM